LQLHSFLKSRMKKPTNKTVFQFGKYFTGGLVYFWVGYAVFALCYSGFGWWWLWAKAAADIAGWTLGYLVQRYWAFAGTQLRLSEMQHVGRYIAVSVVGLALDYLIIAGLNAAGISPYAGFFVAAGFFTVWNYLWYKYWVFPERAPVA
jgi:putative flippase GtrA